MKDVHGEIRAFTSFNHERTRQDSLRSLLFSITCFHHVHHLRFALVENQLATFCLLPSTALTSQSFYRSVCPGGYHGGNQGQQEVLISPSLHSPVLEEGLQRFADGVPLLDSQQVFQLLAEGATVHLDARRKDLCHPLQ